MPRRRGNNEGSIYQHKASGKWCAQVSIQGRRLTHYADTQKECRDWIKKTLSQVEQGMTFDAAQLTVEDYLEDWLSNIKPSLRPKTWNQYAQVARQHVILILGRVKLKDLRPDQVQAMFTKKLEDGASTRTVRLIHDILRRALNQALKWGLIVRNPVLSTTPPKVKKNEMQYLNVDQVRSLLAAVEGTRYAALYHLAVTTGLRQGELLGLCWEDLDWKQKRLQVRRQLQRVTGKGLVFTEPKTKRSKRVVVVGDLTIRRLQFHQELQAKQKLFMGDRWQENDLIFPSTIGTPHEPRNLYRHFSALLKKSELPKIRFHDLRHTAASLMLKQGVHPKVVQERLGHSSIALTLDTYSHVIPSMQSEIANKIDSLLD